MNLEEAIAVTLAFPSGVVEKPRPSKEDQEVIDWARQFVRANALDAIAATREAWNGKPTEPEPSDLIAHAIAEMYGERCRDSDSGCSTCRAWKQYDDLTAEAAKLYDTLPCEVTVSPATRFGKGVKVATVLMALDRCRQEASMGPAGLAAAFDQGQLPPVPPASNLNENNISTPAPEPFQGRQTRADGLIEAAEVLESLAKNYRGLGAKPLADTLTGIAVTFRERSGLEAKTA